MPSGREPGRGSDDLITELLLEISADRARAVDPATAHAHALAWLRDHDPFGTQRAGIVRELRRILGPDRLTDATYAIAARPLATLAGPDLGRGVGMVGSEPD